MDECDRAPQFLDGAQPKACLPKKGERDTGCGGRNRCALLLCLLFLAARAPADPLLFIGSADASVAGAISYGIFRDPLQRPLDAGLAQVDINVPINVSASLHGIMGSMADSSVLIPGMMGEVGQRLNGSLDVSVPMAGGAAFFAIRENAGLRISGGLGDGAFSVDSSLEDMGRVLLRGSMHMPLALDLEWRSLTFGFAARPNRLVSIALQLHKYVVAARLSGELRPDVVGRLDVDAGGSATSIDIDYPADRIGGEARGGFSGEAWSPEMAIRVGPVSLVSRMGARLEARGSLHASYGVPFFIDPGTLDMRFSEPDSFLASENLSRMLNSETSREEWNIREPLVFRMPQSHTLALDLMHGRLRLSYTAVSGSLGTSVRPRHSDSARPRVARFFDTGLTPDHLLLLSSDAGWFRATAGFLTINASYRGRSSLLTPLSPLALGGDPLAPLLEFGFRWGRLARVSMDFHILPLPAVRSGVAYAF